MSIWIYIAWIFCTTITIWIGHRTYLFVRYGVRRDGEVIGMERRRSRRNRSRWSPKVRFVDDRGKTHVFVDSTATSFRRYSIGDVVTIVHLPRRPKDAQVFDLISMCTAPLIGSVLVLFFTFVVLDSRHDLAWLQPGLAWNVNVGLP